MRKILLFVFVWCTLSLNAVNYCATSSWGYAGTVTGGGSANPTLVTNESQLSSALGKAGSVIIITQDITVTNHISTDKSNLTIMALPGKKLISNKQNASESGILYLKGSNLILRNLTFVGPGAYDCDGWDNLCLDGAKNVWVDHCDFQDGVDGNFDIKGKSDNITVTWCRFRYLKEPKAGGSGGADDHRFSNLVGSGSTDKPADNVYNITYGYCWWDEGCKQRMTRCRNALIHYLNCYWNSSVADYYVGPENVSSYFEGCTFAGKANSAKNIYKAFNNTTNYCQFVNCSGNLPSNSGSVSAPTYAYDQLSAADAKSYVIHSSCGAGATLTVTNTGTVSSSCDSGEEPVDPTPVTSDLTWDFSTSDFNNLGTISSTQTINGLTLVATSGSTMTVDASDKTIDGHKFTHRLKTTGSGKADTRHLHFDVTGPCTIEVYLVSAGSADRTLNIYSGSYGGTPLTTMAAPQTTPVKQTYAYSGGATTIYMGSDNSGINFYAINIQYSPTAIENVSSDSKAQKIIREGRLLILRDNKVYNVLGY